MLTIHDKRNTSKDFFIQTLFHMIYIKEKTTGLILRKKNEKPVMFIKDQVFFLINRNFTKHRNTIQNFNIDNHTGYKHLFWHYYIRYSNASFFFKQRIQVHSFTLPSLTNSFNIPVFPFLHEYCWMDGFTFLG